MKSNVHMLKTKRVTFRVEIIESADAIKVFMSQDKPPNPKNKNQFVKWITPILEPFKNDPRPLLLRDMNKGEAAVVIGDEAQGYAVFTKAP